MVFQVYCLRKLKGPKNHSVTIISQTEFKIPLILSFASNNLLEVNFMEADVIPTLLANFLQFITGFPSSFEKQFRFLPNL